MSKLLASMLLFSAVLTAQSPKTYIDMSPTWMQYESEGVSSKFKPTGFKWTLGREVADFSFLSVAVEGSALLGVDNDTKSSVTNSSGTFTNAEVMVDKLYALHLKGIVPITPEFKANVYLGETRGKILSVSDQSSLSGEYKNSFSYGAGLEYWFASDVSLYANYMSYFKNLNAVEVGVGFRF